MTTIQQVKKIRITTPDQGEIISAQGVLGDIVYPAPHPRFIPSKNPPPVGDDVTGIFELVADVDAGAIKDLRETIRDRDYGMDFEIHVPDKCIPVPA